ncbi:MAG: coproporphyrinogen III oxidase family protein [Candidatus Brocadia sp.]|nr:coproporphyrinogen III oxidase family protein [Candidatus Brocadia sp.]
MFTITTDKKQPSSVHHLNRGVDLYIHIPFCKSKCDFCFYVSVTGTSEEERLRYLNALEREISARWSAYEGTQVVVNSLYIGGGTPSILSLKQWEVLVMILTRFWDLRTIPEVTVECNPSSTTQEKLGFFKEIGVNRLSFGVQNVDDSILTAMGREGTNDTLSGLLESTRSAGINNINCDILFGLPGENTASVVQSVDALVELSVPHISVYPFTLQAKTGFFMRMVCKNALPLPAYLRIVHYQRAINRLLEREYLRIHAAHFGISYRYECVQHRNYWDGGEILGFGVSAQSFVDGYYLRNTEDLNKYVKSNDNILSISLSKKDQIRRWVFMSLTKKLRFHYEAMVDRFGLDSLAVIEEGLERMDREGMLSKKQNMVQLTDKGMEHGHLIPIRYFPFENQDYLKYALRIPEAQLRN